MNSKVLQDKLRDIEDGSEMRLLKWSEKNQEIGDDKEKTAVSSSLSTVSLKHYDQLLCDLRCPGCTNLLQAPIYLCTKGHSLCRLCKVSGKTCSVCDGNITNLRSVTLERLSGKFQFPCNNLRNGCSVRLPLELMGWHLEKCMYKKTSCFMGKIWHDCNWRGRENEWLQHCKQNHSKKILKNKEEELVWNFETLKHNGGPIVAYYLIQNFGETFNLYQIHEAKLSTMTWTIILANYKKEQEDPPKFSFEFEFYSKKDPRYLLIQRFPVHYEDSEDVLDDGKCVKVTLTDVQRFLDQEKNLFYRVKIIPEQEKKDRWDELLAKTIHQNHDDLRRNDAFFDQADDQVFMDDEKLMVVSNRHYDYERQDEDMLKQIFEKEFKVTHELSDLTHEATRQMIQKPPRKSLSNRNSLERKRNANSSSHSSMRFDD